MSVYKTVEVQIDDMDLLCHVLDRLGLPYLRSDQHDLVYYKWGGRTVRGRDACVVIGQMNGGLDRTPRHYCGDTAFCRNDNGTYRVELDIAHGDAPINWQRVQNLYALEKVRANLPRGYTLQETVDEATGHVSAVVVPHRRTEQAMRQGDRRRRETRRVRR